MKLTHALTVPRSQTKPPRSSSSSSKGKRDQRTNETFQMERDMSLLLFGKRHGERVATDAAVARAPRRRAAIAPCASQDGLSRLSTSPPRPQLDDRETVCRTTRRSRVGATRRWSTPRTATASAFSRSIYGRFRTRDDRACAEEPRDTCSSAFQLVMVQSPTPVSPPTLKIQRDRIPNRCRFDRRRAARRRCARAVARRSRSWRARPRGASRRSRRRHPPCSSPHR